ncbi:MAG TPA: hypothetical protein VK582_18010 [Pyrinomonadaceae bacterium]|nr:hypothetical protein [Pyrinomonadaceae bacterium]
MRKEQHAKKSIEEQTEGTFPVSYVWRQLSWVLASTALGFLATVFGSIITDSLTISNPQHFATARRLSWFIAGLFLLAFIIVGIATFIRLKNRDVILLKKRLAEIYLSALRKSALNPLLKSTTSNE